MKAKVDAEPCHFRLNIAKAPAGQEATTLCITLRTCPHLAGTRDTSSVGWWKGFMGDHGPWSKEQSSLKEATAFASPCLSAKFNHITLVFPREQKWGLNTYLYAPKDDYKHRMYWRELYSPEEAEQLVALISAAENNQVEFIYAISPGLDITFSNPKEVASLKRKLDQVGL
ncbi:hypothetical protein AMECASPLE_033895 [Ameca splendens]|uniref:GH84 domain-containing protein n=1 Tax=Ameca splendens TaxID=208324 RepID=A0ABV0XVY1_9TELE